MSEEAPSPPRKRGGLKLLLIVLPIVLIMGGAGIAGGLYAAGAFGHAEEVPEEDPAKPRLVLKGEDPVAIADKFGGGGGEGKEGTPPVSAPSGIKLPKGGVELPSPKDPSKYQATYFQMPAPYTANLADTATLMQMSLAVSTYYDNRVINAVKTHEMAVRSEILMMLSQEHEIEIATPQGKVALQKKLTRLINRVIKDKTGYSGVDNVYFTNFVIQ